MQGYPQYKGKGTGLPTIQRKRYRFIHNTKEKVQGYPQYKGKDTGLPTIQRIRYRVTHNSKEKIQGFTQYKGKDTGLHTIQRIRYKVGVSKTHRRIYPFTTFYFSGTVMYSYTGRGFLVSIYYYYFIVMTNVDMVRCTLTSAVVLLHA